MPEREKFFGSVYGLAVGDALGVPAEFCDRETLDLDPVKGMRAGGAHGQEKGTWSDDTSMVLAAMDAMSGGGLPLEKIMEHFRRWLVEAEYTASGNVFDVGGTTSAAIHHYMRGEPLERWGLADEQSNGNGSLMRMLPMVYYVLLTYGSEINPVAVDQIYRFSALTHAHILSRMCCVYYVYIGIYLLEYGRKQGIQGTVREAVEAVEDYYEKQGEPSCALRAAGLRGLIGCAGFPREAIQSSGYVLHSLTASIWCLWNTSSYREAVLTAVNLGDDADTTGAIAGSLAGIHYGEEGIPKEWLDDLKNRKMITDIASRFYTRLRG